MVCLNDGVVTNVHTIQHHAGCTNDVTINPQLRLAAQWHTEDVLTNAALNGDSVQTGRRCRVVLNAARFKGSATETVAINPALAITGIEILKQGYYNPTTWRSCRTVLTPRGCVVGE